MLAGAKAGGLGLAERKRGRKGCCFLSHRSSKRCHFLHRLSLFSPKYVFSLPEYNSSPKGRRLYPQIPLHLPRGRRFLPENVTVLRNTYFSPPNVTFSTQNITTPLQKSSFSRKVENFFSPTLFPPQHDIPAKGKCSHNNARSYPKIRSSREDNIVFPDSITFFPKDEKFFSCKRKLRNCPSPLLSAEILSRGEQLGKAFGRVPECRLLPTARPFGQFGSRQRATSAGCFPPNRGLFSAARKGAILPSPCVLAESTSPGATIQSHWRLNLDRVRFSLFLHCCTLTFCYGGEKERRLSVKKVTGTLSSASSCDLCVNTRRRVKCHLLGCKVVFWGKNNAVF